MQRNDHTPAMGLNHTATMLSRETEKALFYLPSLAPKFFTGWWKKAFSVSRDNMAAVWLRPTAMCMCVWKGGKEGPHLPPPIPCISSSSPYQSFSTNFPLLLPLPTLFNHPAPALSSPLPLLPSIPPGSNPPVLPHKCVHTYTLPIPRRLFIYDNNFCWLNT